MHFSSKILSWSLQDSCKIWQVICKIFLANSCTIHVLNSCKILWILIQELSRQILQESWHESCRFQCVCMLPTLWTFRLSFSCRLFPPTCRWEEVRLGARLVVNCVLCKPRDRIQSTTTLTLTDHRDRSVLSQLPSLPAPHLYIVKHNFLTKL